MDGLNFLINLEFFGGGFEYVVDEEFGKDFGVLEKVEDVLFSFDYILCYWYELCVYCCLNYGYFFVILLVLD